MIAFFFALVGVMAIVFHAGLEREHELLALKETDPQAYLETLKARNNDRWLRELAGMDPPAHAREMDRLKRKSEREKAEAVIEEVMTYCKSRIALREAYTTATRFVARELKSPATADFPSMGDVNVHPTANCSFEIRGYVDAQNSFGALIRSDYRATLSRDRENRHRWHLGSLRFL